jgi:hypothetical protein
MKSQKQLLLDLMEHMGGPEMVAEFQATLGPRLKWNSNVEKNLPNLSDEEYNVKLEAMKKEAPAFIKFLKSGTHTKSPESKAELKKILDSGENN